MTAPRDARADGRDAALRRYGVAKTALAAPPNDAPPDESHATRNALMAGAAATPFLGMIGQKPLIHDPHLNPDIRRFKTMTELSREARAGDVLMTTKPEGSFWKHTIKPLSGSEFYHAQPVVGRRGGHGLTMSAGQYDDPTYRKAPLSVMKGDLDSVLTRSKFEEYPDIMLMRPKVPLTPEQTKAFTLEAMKRGRQRYDQNQAPLTWLKEMFLPKIGDPSSNPLPSIKDDNVCSSLPAMAHAKAGGPSVVPGKAARDVFPSDFLRSENFEPVGVRMKNEYTQSNAMRRAMPYLARAGMGAGLAAGVYGVSKDPALAALPAGIVGGHMLGDALNRWRGVAAPTSRARFIPGIAGGVAAYFGARGLQHALRPPTDAAAEPPPA